MRRSWPEALSESESRRTWFSLSRTQAAIFPRSRSIRKKWPASSSSSRPSPRVHVYGNVCYNCAKVTANIRDSQQQLKIRNNRGEKQFADNEINRANDYNPFSENNMVEHDYLVKILLTSFKQVRELVIGEPSRICSGAENHIFATWKFFNLSFVMEINSGEN